MTADPLSPRNAEVARLRALARERRARHEAGRFVVEGIKLVDEVLASDLDVLEIYAAESWSAAADTSGHMDRRDIDVTLVSDRGIERIASTTSPQPVVAEVRIPASSLADLASASAVLVAADVNDPGNVGALARSAVAAGFDAIVCLGDTADPFAPKSIRAAAGALFRVPVVVERDAVAGLASLADAGLHRLGTRMQNADACDEADLTNRVAVVMGSEAHGLDDDYSASIDQWLAIPMPGETESLNVAMAGAILSYEVARQRRSAAQPAPESD